MKLTELEPQFIRYEARIETYEIIVGDSATWRDRGCPTEVVTGPKQWQICVNTLDQAQGIRFLCPKCFQQNGGDVGTHGCDVTFEGRGVAEEHGSHGSTGATRWGVSGTGYDDLTTTPSILLVGGCAWHGFITNGEIIGA